MCIRDRLTIIHDDIRLETTVFCRTHTGEVDTVFGFPILFLKIEVMPLKAEEYAELKEHGLNGVCLLYTSNTRLKASSSFGFTARRK